MPTASNGEWQFLVPDGWRIKDAGESYLESADGAKGMYVKCIKLRDPKESPGVLASYIQNTHRVSYEELDGSNWHLMDRSDQLDGEFHRSALDMYDLDAS